MWLSSVILVPPLLLSQAAGSEPPLVNRPANFSRLVGTFRIESEAEEPTALPVLGARTVGLLGSPLGQGPFLAAFALITGRTPPTTVEVEKPVLLKVRIKGDGEKGFLPQRKFLKIFPDHFAEQFFVEDLPELDRLAPADKTWEFVYRLRPKSTTVEYIPGLKLAYFQPGRKKYTASFAEAIPLIVKPASSPQVELPAVTVVFAPETFFQTASPQASLSWRPYISPGPKSLLELLALGLVVFLLFAIGWRGTKADGQRERARLHLLYAGSIRHLRGAMINYLHRRLHLEDSDWTGFEVIQSLRRRGMERPLLAKFQAFLAQCDAARFSPNPTSPETTLDRLSLDAQQLIHSLEADPCVSRSA